jgi:hypothetical protein
MKQCGSEHLWCELFEMGKRSGVASKVHFIVARPGTDTRKVWQASIRAESMESAVSRMNSSFHFLGLNHPLDFLHYSGCHQSSVRRMEQTGWGHGAAWSGTAGVTGSMSMKNKEETRTTWAG